jgi:hypothetical protein
MLREEEFHIHGNHLFEMSGGHSQEKLGKCEAKKGEKF